MKMRAFLIACLMVATLAFSAHARPTKINKDPEAKNRSSVRFLPPARIVPHIRSHLALKDRSRLKDIKAKDTMVKSSLQKNKSMSKPQSHVLLKLKKQETPLSKLSNIKSKFQVLSAHHQKNVQISTSALKENEKIMQLKESTVIPTPKISETTHIKPTDAAPVKETTLDPWDQFCQEACEEGKAGPECDCAEHPIGRRHAPLSETGLKEISFNRLRSNIFKIIKRVHKSKPSPSPDVYTTETHITDSTVSDVTSPSDESSEEFSEEYNITSENPIDGSGEGEGDGDNKTTTKNPIDEFCSVACLEGQGSVVCDCRGYIIG